MSDKPISPPLAIQKNEKSRQHNKKVNKLIKILKTPNKIPPPFFVIRIMLNTILENAKPIVISGSKIKRMPRIIFPCPDQSFQRIANSNITDNIANKPHKMEACSNLRNLVVEFRELSFEPTTGTVESIYTTQAI